MASVTEVSVIVEDPHGDAAARLIKNLSAELGERYGDDGSGAFSPDDVQVPGGAFVIAWLDHQPVGCGALRPLERGVGEVKRMFVEKDARRQGIAKKILGKIEAIACVLGYRALRLETGILQPEAIKLYESAGYRRVCCYGHYADNPLSVCFEKRFC
ncbi:MAG: GNAT family N-acetyltransferase [Anaerolineae bacterium]|jgi:putative acetyltransferase